MGVRGKPQSSEIDPWEVNRRVWRERSAKVRDLPAIEIIDGSDVEIEPTVAPVLPKSLCGARFGALSIRNSPHLIGPSAGREDSPCLMVGPRSAVANRILGPIQAARTAETEEGPTTRC